MEEATLVFAGAKGKRGMKKARKACGVLFFVDLRREMRLAEHKKHAYIAAVLCFGLEWLEVFVAVFVRLMGEAAVC